MPIKCRYSFPVECFTILYHRGCNWELFICNRKRHKRPNHKAHLHKLIWIEQNWKYKIADCIFTDFISDLIRGTDGSNFYFKLLMYILGNLSFMLWVILLENKMSYFTGRSRFFSMSSMFLLHSFLMKNNWLHQW